jgi:asparagine synthase (glutamine-hydrolysing)
VKNTKGNDYLVIGFEDHTRETFFKNVYQLKGGEYAILDLNKRTFEKKRYYDLQGINKLACKESDYYLRFKELFTDSVKLRLRSDVPVGSCLSGGLDSSAIVSVIATLWKEGRLPFFNTFTACWDDKKIDERKYAEAIVESSGVSGNYIYPTSEDLTKDLASLIWHQEEPFGGLSIFAQWSVMKAAHNKGVTVLLDGQGGDEVFLGYERYYAWVLLDLIRQSKVKLFIHELMMGANNSKLSQSEIILFYFYFNFNQIRALRLYQRAKNFMKKDFMKLYNISDRLNTFKKIGTTADLQKLEIQDVQLPHLLKYADRNSMAFSIETRLPILDYRLVEFALSIPAEFAIRNGWTKNVMREGLKGIIPENIRKRKNKVGFEAPQASLLRVILPQLLAKLQKGTMLEKYFNMDWLMDRIKNNDLNNITMWKALCLDLWSREFFE